MNQANQTPYTYEDDEINLLDYWRVIYKRKRLIIAIVVVSVFITAVYSLVLTKIYRSSAVITPVSHKGEGGGRLSAIARQFGGIPGISLPASASISEIMSILNSNVLMLETVGSHELLPVLFSDKWDSAAKKWKGQSHIPTDWDIIRRLKGILNIKNNIKNNTITVSADFRDPDAAARIVKDLLETLNEHMSMKAIKNADNNRKYLEGQIAKTLDPMIRQKIYSLIAKQLEVSMMAGKKENFAFKVLDPPMAPDRRIKPKRKQMVMLGFVVSLFVAVLLSFFLEYIDKMRQGVKQG